MLPVGESMSIGDPIRATRVGAGILKSLTHVLLCSVVLASYAYFELI